MPSQHPFRPVPPSGRTFHLLSLDGLRPSTNGVDVVSVAVEEHQAAAGFRAGDLLVAAVPLWACRTLAPDLAGRYRFLPVRREAGPECLRRLVEAEEQVLRRFDGVVVSGRGRGFGSLLDALSSLPVAVVGVRTAFDPGPAPGSSTERRPLLGAAA